MNNVLLNPAWKPFSERHLCYLGYPDIPLLFFQAYLNAVLYWPSYFTKVAAAAMLPATQLEAANEDFPKKTLILRVA